jgi:hypothetical protein
MTGKKTVVGIEQQAINLGIYRRAILRANLEIAKFIVKIQTVMRAEAGRAEMTFLLTGRQIINPESIGIACATATQATIGTSLVSKFEFSNPPANPVAGKMAHGEAGLRRAKDRVEAFQVRRLTVV